MISGMARLLSELQAFKRYHSVVKFLRFAVIAGIFVKDRSVYDARGDSTAEFDLSWKNEDDHVRARVRSHGREEGAGSRIFHFDMC